jgi:hypothetical protein
MCLESHMTQPIRLEAAIFGLPAAYSSCKVG